MKRGALFGIFLFLSMTSCIVSPLNIQTQYLSEEYLASYHVGTPDPRLTHPSIGQRLLIQWSLSLDEMANRPIELYLKIRLRNREEREIYYSITKKRGTYYYDLIGQDYLDSKGILTYKAEIRSNGVSFVSWKHPLWIELIVLNQK